MVKFKLAFGCDKLYKVAVGTVLCTHFMVCCVRKYEAYSKGCICSLQRASLRTSWLAPAVLLADFAGCLYVCCAGSVGVYS